MRVPQNDANFGIGTLGQLPLQACSAADEARPEYRPYRSGSVYIELEEETSQCRTTISTLTRKSREWASMCAKARVYPIWPIPRNGHLMAVRHKANCRPNS